MLRRILLLACVLLSTPSSLLAQEKGAHVVFLVGESEYGSERTMPEFAERLREEHGLRTTLLQSTDGRLPALDALDEADALVLFLRFRRATDAQIARLDEWIEAGKPTIALRTTSHAFLERQDWFPSRFGGHYRTHAPNGQGTVVRVAADEADHPIVAALPRAFEAGYGGTYDAMPLRRGARVLLFGRTGDLPSQPVAWTYREASGARLFYTSLGSEENFARAEFRELLERAVLWSIGRLPAGPAFRSEPWNAAPERGLVEGARALLGNGFEGWRHWDPGVPPRAIELDRRADTGAAEAYDPAPRWRLDDDRRSLVANPGFGDLLSEESFGNVELSFDYYVPAEIPRRSVPELLGGGLDPLRGAVYMEGRYRIPVTADDTKWHRMTIAWRHDQGRKPIAEVRVDDGDVERIEFERPSPYGFLSGAAAGGIEPLPGLRHVYADAPALDAGDFAFVARFKARGDGTLVGKAPAAGHWAPNGKSLFIRGGRLVYDIGWVGALGGGPRVTKGQWHTVVLTHEGDTAVLFLDGEEVGRKPDFVAEDPSDMVVKVGATSDNFGGGLTDGEIARVLVFDAALDLATARSVSAGGFEGLAPAIDWDPAVESNVPQPEAGVAVRGPIRLHADNAAVEFANLQVRPLGDVDHRALVAGFDDAAFERGKQLYSGMCAACHGFDGEQVLNPLARAFSKAEFQNGKDPYALFRTLTDGFRNMPPQTWMTPAQRYDVIHYLREAFLKEQNPGQYFQVTDAWLGSLPPALPALDDANAVVGAAGDAADELPARDFGPGLICQIGPDVPAGLAVRLPGDVTIGYDLHRAASVGAWRGAFLDLAETQHYQQRGEGIGQPGAEAWWWTTAWAWDFTGVERPERGPYARADYRLRGRFHHGRDLVLHSEIHGREVFESPSAEVLGEQVALVHRFAVGPGASELRLRWADDGFDVRVVDDLAVARRGLEQRASLVRVLGDEVLFEGGLLRVPAGDSPVVFTVVRADASSDEQISAFAAFVELQADRLAADPRALCKGGPRLWDESIVTHGELGDAELPYAVDTLPLPDDNPWGAWLRTSALDFFSDGRCAVCTLGGDVWIVDGIDGDLDELRWTRFAAGLFEPLGLKVVDDIVYVTCRDGVWRLFDQDGNGEADHHDCFHQDVDVSATFHAFNFDLQQDAQGRLSYVKSGRYTSFPTPGAVVRLSPDGEQWEYIATGFRTPNGMGILPDGSLLVSDNQGNWVPASKVSRIREGGFYGVFKGNEQETEDFDRPLIWLPQDVDSSSGGQLWLDDERFGPLAGTLLHTSFGKGWCYALELQEIGDVTQASCVTLPFQFAAGVQRARTHPIDGQVYVTGLSGWQGPAGGKDGCLQRLRFTGKQQTMLRGAEVTAKGVTLHFTGPVPAEAAEPSRYTAETWNYRWAARYGSDQWSVREPERQGHDRLEVTAAQLGDDGRSVELDIPGIAPADQLRIDGDLPGLASAGSVLLTVHALPGSR